MSRFFIIDGYALLYRSYFALIKNPTKTSYGLDTSALYGFVKTLFTLLDLWHPDYITVVFDTNAKTWRHESFREYKATRPKQPQVITDSLPYLKDILTAMSITFYEKEGFEADDLAGTMTKKIPEDINIYLMTQDKDYAQLVKKNVFLFKSIMSSGYKAFAMSEVLTLWGVATPEQVVDILALVGDTSDNIPGVVGVGKETAKKLIQQYMSVENILVHKDELPDKIKNNIDDEKLIMSKKLVTITTDVDFCFDYNECIKKDFNDQALGKIFKQLEFESFYKKISRPKKEGQLGLF